MAMEQASDDLLPEIQQPGMALDTQGDQMTALDAFGVALSAIRREAIDGRLQLGIEDEWLQDEEFYVGIDDANRHEFATTYRQSKPRSGAVLADGPKADSNKSFIFLNITRPYVDAAAARMGDMLLPADDRCWAIEPSPIPELPEAAQAEIMAMLDDGTPITAKEVHEETKKIAAERAEKATDRIDDWMTECRFSAQARSSIESAAKLGTGILKGPFPRTKRRAMWERDQITGAFAKSVKAETMPASVVLDPWNVYPDPACGEDIQDGSYIWERDPITVKRLMALRDNQGYIAEQIDRCIKEGPIQPELVWTPTTDIERAVQTAENRQFEVWYYHGICKVSDLEAAGVEIPPDMQDEHADAVVTMCNHRVIRASFAPLGESDFPYDFAVWQKRPGMPWGMGVARQIRAAQRVLLAASRNLMDNAGLSAGPQIVINTKVIRPLDGRYELTPRKLWIAVDNADPAEPIDVEEAFKVFSIETRQAELLNIINFALRMAEESTGLPMILQGQQGEKGPDTLGGMKMLQNNASAVLRRLAIMFDERVTVPHVGRYYEWLMEHGENEDEKGDFTVKARGSSTLVEREIQNQELLGILQVAKDPVYGLSPEKAVDEYLRSRRFDPERFKPTEEELLAAQQAQMEAGAMPDPALQAKGDMQAQALDAKAAEGDAQREHEKQMQILGANIQAAQTNAERAGAMA